MRTITKQPPLFPTTQLCHTHHPRTTHPRARAHKHMLHILHTYKFIPKRSQEKNKKSKKSEILMHHSNFDNHLNQKIIPELFLPRKQDCLEYGFALPLVRCESRCYYNLLKEARKRESIFCVKLCMFSLPLLDHRAHMHGITDLYRCRGLLLQPRRHFLRCSLFVLKSVFLGTK